MPHIHAILLGSDAEAVTILRKNKYKIRRAFAKLLTYKVKEVVLFARLLTEPEAELSQNLDRIEFVVDTGVLTQITGSSAFIDAELSVKIPELDAIKFGVWVRGFPENSYCKHTPRIH